ncbi:hypothetical protein BGZ49_003116 [Haplosporangium sp. Z 27]|nr:hypothetical protein BGZ49_003116 [Haplosporangium sp. Z 27]
MGISAGTNPASEVHGVALEIMLEVGIDLSNIKPPKLIPEFVQKVGIIATMGCGEACPFAPGVKIVD